MYQIKIPRELFARLKEEAAKIAGMCQYTGPMRVVFAPNGDYIVIANPQTLQVLIDRLERGLK